MYTSLFCCLNLSIVKEASLRKASRKISRLQILLELSWFLTATQISCSSFLSALVEGRLLLLSRIKVSLPTKYSTSLYLTLIPPVTIKGFNSRANSSRYFFSPAVSLKPSNIAFATAIEPDSGSWLLAFSRLCLIALVSIVINIEVKKALSTFSYQVRFFNLCFPSVSVPFKSNITVSIALAFSKASPLANTNPDCLAFSLPTFKNKGPINPRVQGHAETRTAITQLIANKGPRYIPTVIPEIKAIKNTQRIKYTNRRFIFSLIGAGVLLASRLTLSILDK